MLKKFQPLFLALVLCSFTVLLTGCDRNTSGSFAEKTSDRVLRTNILRCGYSVWAPLFIVDPNTKKMSGIFYDLMEEAGQRLGVKIVWQEELGWDTAPEAVKTHRVDMACSGYFLQNNRIKATSSIAPRFYTGLYIWARGDDNRTFENPDMLNNARYRFVRIDGGASNSIIASRFPQAKTMDLPGIIGTADLMTAVTTRKADFFIDDESGANVWLKDHPGSLKKLFPQPMGIFPVVMMLPPDDPRFKEIIDNTLAGIEYDGMLDRILQKYKVDKIFLRNPPLVGR